MGSNPFLRTLLSRYTGLPSEQLEFERGEYGKPYLLHAPIPVHFSLSHSGEWTVCAVGLNSPLGLDLEYHREGRDILKLARRFYHASEYEALVDRRGMPLARLFYDLWTLKESWVKARGGALGRELESTVFRLDGAGQFEPGPVEKVPAPNDPPHSCYLLRGPVGYSLALSSLLRDPIVRLFSPDDAGVLQGSLLSAGTGSHC